MVKTAVPFLRLLPLLLLLSVTLTAGAEEPALQRVALPDARVFCVRVRAVPSDFAAQLQALQPTNALIGTVLDLRFASGTEGDGDAAATRDFFARSPAPLILLVNRETRDGAAALAADLCAARRALLISSPNPPANLTPYLTVAMDSAGEKKFQQNPFAPPAPLPAAGATNALAIFVDHMSEAILVSQRAKDSEANDARRPRVEPPYPIIRDPALARAVDLLQALAALRP